MYKQVIAGAKIEYAGQAVWLGDNGRIYPVGENMKKQIHEGEAVQHRCGHIAEVQVWKDERRLSQIMRINEHADCPFCARAKGPQGPHFFILDRPLDEEQKQSLISALKSEVPCYLSPRSDPWLQAAAGMNTVAVAPAPVIPELPPHRFAIGERVVACNSDRWIGRIKRYEGADYIIEWETGGESMIYATNLASHPEEQTTPMLNPIPDSSANLPRGGWV